MDKMSIVDVSMYIPELQRETGSLTQTGNVDKCVCNQGFTGESSPLLDLPCELRHCTVTDLLLSSVPFTVENKQIQ